MWRTKEEKSWARGCATAGCGGGRGPRPPWPEGGVLLAGAARAGPFSKHSQADLCLVCVMLQLRRTRRKTESFHFFFNARSSALSVLFFRVFRDWSSLPRQNDHRVVFHGNSRFARACSSTQRSRRSSTVSCFLSGLGCR